MIWNNKYGAFGTDPDTSTTARTTLYLHANEADEIGEVIYLAAFGSGGVAGDDVQHRQTAVYADGSVGGTKTAVTPQIMRGTGVAAKFVCNENYTVEPGAFVAGTEPFCVLSFNQRGGLPWAMPAGEGALLAQGATNRAVAWRNISDQAGKVDANAQWWEF